MTKEEFQQLGTKMHYNMRAEWNGKKWKLTQTIQSTETCMLNSPHRKKYSIATGYKYVTLIKGKESAVNNG